MPVRLVYLHGFASGPGSQKARYFQERFAELGFDLHVPDLTAGDFEHLTITGQLKVIESAAGGESAFLIGSSMGGYLAALYAARHPEIQRVVLMAPAFGFLRRWPDSFGAERFEEWRRTGYLEVYHYGERRARRLWFQLVEDGAQYEDYPALWQPALLFHGEEDTTVPLCYSREFCGLYPQARLEVLASDHELLNVLPRIWEQTRQFLLGPREADGGIRH